MRAKKKVSLSGRNPTTAQRTGSSNGSEARDLLSCRDDVQVGDVSPEDAPYARQIVPEPAYGSTQLLQARTQS